MTDDAHSVLKLETGPDVNPSRFVLRSARDRYRSIVS